MASPPFTPDETKPGDSDTISPYPALERNFRDIVESWLLYEHANTGRHSFEVDSTANLDALPGWAIGALRFNTTLNHLQIHNGSAFVTLQEFPSGTRLVFQQTAAPAGWTKETGAAFDGAMLRGETGTVSSGGTNDPSALTPAGSVTVNSHTLTIAEMPAHEHFVAAAVTLVSHNDLEATEQLARRQDDGTQEEYNLGGTATAATVGLSSSTGGGGGHSHTGSFSGNALAIKFYDVIVATKN